MRIKVKGEIKNYESWLVKIGTHISFFLNQEEDTHKAKGCLIDVTGISNGIYEMEIKLDNEYRYISDCIDSNKKIRITPNF